MELLEDWCFHPGKKTLLNESLGMCGEACLPPVGTPLHHCSAVGIQSRLSLKFKLGRAIIVLTKTDLGIITREKSTRAGLHQTESAPMSHAVTPSGSGTTNL